MTDRPEFGFKISQLNDISLLLTSLSKLEASRDDPSKLRESVRGVSRNFVRNMLTDGIPSSIALRQMAAI